MTTVAEARLRVRYAETDQMGVVYYANYLIWMEVGRVELCRVCGFRYRDMERLSNFQNRLLAKYAKAHDIPFIDTARYFPLDPDLFVDAVHTNYGGLRLQAWITFNLLLPVVEKHLADRSWPRPTDPAAPALPTITARKITFTCQ